MKIINVANEQDVIAKLCSLTETIANGAIEKKGSFLIGLSGGSLVKYLSSGLPNIKTDWSKWTLAFCDERVVPEDSEDSTFGTYKRDLLPKVKQLNEEQFVTIKQGVNSAEAAKDYTNKLKKAFSIDSDDFQFDLLLLGMGPDGHTCSLFPNHKLADESAVSVAAIDDSPKPPPSRITLTFKVINQAENCIFAVSGAGKAQMIERILKNKEDLPAGRVKPKSGNVYWVLDNEASSKL